MVGITSPNMAAVDAFQPTSLPSTVVSNIPGIERTQIMCPVPLFIRPGLNSDPGAYLDPYYGICGSTPMVYVNALFQQFENGFMVWESQSETVYVLYNSGTGLALSADMYGTYFDNLTPTFPTSIVASTATPLALTVAFSPRFAPI
jgi:hypothetical protein